MNADNYYKVAVYLLEGRRVRSICFPFVSADVESQARAECDAIEYAECTGGRLSVFRGPSAAPVVGVGGGFEAS